jgi:hypothetical protein
MDAIEGLKAVCRDTAETAVHIDAEIRRKLLRRARNYGMTTNEGEIIVLVEAWKRAARKTRRAEWRHQSDN